MYKYTNPMHKGHGSAENPADGVDASLTEGSVAASDTFSSVGNDERARIVDFLKDFADRDVEADGEAKEGASSAVVFPASAASAGAAPASAASFRRSTSGTVLPKLIAVIRGFEEKHGLPHSELESRIHHSALIKDNIIIGADEWDTVNAWVGALLSAYPSEHDPRKQASMLVDLVAWFSRIQVESPDMSSVDVKHIRMLRLAMSYLPITLSSVKAQAWLTLELHKIANAGSVGDLRDFVLDHLDSLLTQFTTKPLRTSICAECILYWMLNPMPEHCPSQADLKRAMREIDFVDREGAVSILVLELLEQRYQAFGEKLHLPNVQLHSLGTMSFPLEPGASLHGYLIDIAEFVGLDRMTLDRDPVLQDEVYRMLLGAFSDDHIALNQFISGFSQLVTHVAFSPKVPRQNVSGTLICSMFAGHTINRLVVARQPDGIYSIELHYACSTMRVMNVKKGVLSHYPIQMKQCSRFHLTGPHLTLVSTEFTGADRDLGLALWRSGQDLDESTMRRIDDIMSRGEFSDEEAERFRLNIVIPATAAFYKQQSSAAYMPSAVRQPGFLPEFDIHKFDESRRLVSELQAADVPAAHGSGDSDSVISEEGDEFSDFTDQFKTMLTHLGLPDTFEFEGAYCNERSISGDPTSVCLAPADFVVIKQLCEAFDRHYPPGHPDRNEKATELQAFLSHIRLYPLGATPERQQEANSLQVMLRVLPLCDFTIFYLAMVRGADSPIIAAKQLFVSPHLSLLTKQEMLRELVLYQFVKGQLDLTTLSNKLGELIRFYRIPLSKEHYEGFYDSVLRSIQNRIETQDFLAKVDGSREFPGACFGRLAKDCAHIRFYDDMGPFIHGGRGLEPNLTQQVDDAFRRALGAEVFKREYPAFKLTYDQTVNRLSGCLINGLAFSGSTIFAKQRMTEAAYSVTVSEEGKLRLTHCTHYEALLRGQNEFDTNASLHGVDATIETHFELQGSQLVAIGHQITGPDAQLFDHLLHEQGKGKPIPAYLYRQLNQRYLGPDNTSSVAWGTFSEDNRSTRKGIGLSDRAKDSHLALEEYAGCVHRLAQAIADSPGRKAYYLRQLDYFLQKMATTGPVGLRVKYLLEFKQKSLEPGHVFNIFHEAKGPVRHRTSDMRTSRMWFNYERALQKACAKHPQFSGYFNASWSFRPQIWGVTPKQAKRKFVAQVVGQTSIHQLFTFTEKSLPTGWIKDPIWTAAVTKRIQEWAKLVIVERTGVRGIRRWLSGLRDDWRRARDAQDQAVLKEAIAEVGLSQDMMKMVTSTWRSDDPLRRMMQETVAERTVEVVLHKVPHVAEAKAELDSLPISAAMAASAASAASAAGAALDDDDDEVYVAPLSPEGEGLEGDVEHKVPVTSELPPYNMERFSCAFNAYVNGAISDRAFMQHIQTLEAYAVQMSRTLTTEQRAASEYPVRDILQALLLGITRPNAIAIPTFLHDMAHGSSYVLPDLLVKLIHIDPRSEPCSDEDLDTSWFAEVDAVPDEALDLYEALGPEVDTVDAMSIAVSIYSDESGLPGSSASVHSARAPSAPQSRYQQLISAMMAGTRLRDAELEWNSRNQIVGPDGKGVRVSRTLFDLCQACGIPTRTTCFPVGPALSSMNILERRNLVACVLGSPALLDGTFKRPVESSLSASEHLAEPTASA